MVREPASSDRRIIMPHAPPDMYWIIISAETAHGRAGPEHEADQIRAHELRVIGQEEADDQRHHAYDSDDQRSALMLAQIADKRRGKRILIFNDHCFVIPGFAAEVGAALGLSGVAGAPAGSGATLSGDSSDRRLRNERQIFDAFAFTGRRLRAGRGKLGLQLGREIALVDILAILQRADVSDDGPAVARGICAA